jgi:hypothetical protein
LFIRHALTLRVRPAKVAMAGEHRLRLQAPPAVLGVVAATFIAGVVLRVWVLGSPLGDVDIDEATMDLQARAFLDGHPAVFFPTQGYGGTAETALVAAAFAVFGEGWLALKMVALGLHLAATVVTWRAACRLSSSTVGRLVPPMLLWVGSPFGIWESTKARGFYGVAIVLAAVVLLLVVRLHERPSRIDMAGLGLCLGLAVWTTPLLAAAVVPPVGWLAARRPGLWRRLPFLVGPALTGALPSIVWNVRNSWGSLESPGTFGSSWPERLGNRLERSASMTGFATPFDPDRRLLPTAVAVALLATLVALAAWSSRAAAPGFVPVCVLGYGVLQAFNGLAVAVGDDDRYLYPMLPLVALVFGLAADEGGRRLRHAPVIELGALGVAAFALSTWGLVGLRDVATKANPDHFVASPGLEEVVAELEARRVDVVTTDVVGHQIMFLSGGRVTASSFGVPRFDDVEVTAAEHGRCTYVLRRGHLDDLAPRQLSAHLEREGIAFDHEEIGTFALYVLSEPVDPADVPLTWFVSPVPSVPGATRQQAC